MTSCRIVPFVLGLVALLAPERTVGAPPLGAVACGACHPEAYRIWQGTAHARTTDARVLGARGGTCRVCHTTGEGAGPARLPGVQCEACHGLGAAYAPADVMRDRPLARVLGLRDLSVDRGCERCHRRSTRRESFDVERAWERIRH